MIFNNEYYHVKPREIDQTISWLSGVIKDCELKISKLESIKSGHERSKKREKRFRDLAQEYATDEFMGIDIDNQIEIIRQRYGCDYKEAEDIRELAIKFAKRRSRKLRNIKIAKLYEAGINVTDIAAECDLSRQSVHAIIKEHKNDPLF